MKNYMETKQGLKVFVGRVIKDVEPVKTIGTKGITVATVCCGVGDRQEGDLINVSCWRDKAYYAATLCKGDEVLVFGMEAEPFTAKDGRVFRKVDAAYISKQPEAAHQSRAAKADPGGEAYLEPNESDPF